MTKTAQLSAAETRPRTTLLGAAGLSHNSLGARGRPFGLCLLGAREGLQQLDCIQEEDVEIFKTSPSPPKGPSLTSQEQGQTGRARQGGCRPWVPISLGQSVCPGGAEGTRKAPFGSARGRFLLLWEQTRQGSCSLFAALLWLQHTSRQLCLVLLEQPQHTPKKLPGWGDL